MYQETFPMLRQVCPIKPQQSSFLEDSSMILKPENHGRGLGSQVLGDLGSPISFLVSPHYWDNQGKYSLSFSIFTYQFCKTLVSLPLIQSTLAYIGLKFGSFTMYCASDTTISVWFLASDVFEIVKNLDCCAAHNGSWLYRSYRQVFFSARQDKLQKKRPSAQGVWTFPCMI